MKIEIKGNQPVYTCLDCECILIGFSEEEVRCSQCLEKLLHKIMEEKVT